MLVNPIGCHGSVWVPSIEARELARAAELTRRAGFELIELPLMDPEALDPAAARRSLAAHELTATASLGLTPEDDLSSDDPAVSTRGERRLGRALEVVSDAGGVSLCGVLASAMGKYSAPATVRGRAHSAAALGRLGARARELGLGLSIELVNRYESNLINVAEDGLRFLEEVGGDAVTLHLDSYHMNIEESDQRTPLLAAGPRLGYLHAGESHRGALGTGTVDFESFFAGVLDADFRGPIVFESFSSAIVNDQYASALGIWRNLWSDPLALATQASAFIRDGLARAAANSGLRQSTPA